MIGVSKMKLLLLDLDGTVRKPISDSTFIRHPEDQQIIPNAGWAIAIHVGSSSNAM